MIIKPKTFHKAFCVMIQGLHAMNESITTINSFAKTIRELNDEVHNDSICGAWTDQSKYYSLSISKVSQGYRDTLFTHTNGRKLLYKQFFIQPKNGTLSGECTNGGINFEWITNDQPLPTTSGERCEPEKAIIEMGKIDNSLSFGNFGLFFRDEVIYPY